MTLPLSLAKTRDPFKVIEAREEVMAKSVADINQETAIKWCGRSLACYELYAETRKKSWLLAAEDYRSEAIEHAALADDSGKTLKKVQSAIDKIRPKN